jgi:hypothetical protein
MSNRKSADDLERTCAAGALGLESFVHGALLVWGAQGAVAVGRGGAALAGGGGGLGELRLQCPLGREAQKIGLFIPQQNDAPIRWRCRREVGTLSASNFMYSVE